MSVFTASSGERFSSENFAYCLRPIPAAEVVFNDLGDAQVGAEPFQRPNENPLKVSHRSFSDSLSDISSPAIKSSTRDTIVNTLTAVLLRS